MRLLGLVLITVLPGAALAETLSGDAARTQLFDPAGVQVGIVANAALPADQTEILKVVAADQPYYGAIAISPGEGLMSEATVAAANYHDERAATAAALAGCSAKKTADAACVVVAVIRPKGWEARAVTLSADATAGFEKDYPAKGGALAISASTGAWGIAAGGDDAVAACSAKNSAATDCVVVIAD